jgi:DNA-binding NarL/FixJ family response regulator
MSWNSRLGVPVDAIHAHVDQQRAEERQKAEAYRLAIAVRGFLARETGTAVEILDVVRRRARGEKDRAQAKRLGVDPQTIRDQVKNAVRKIRLHFPDDADRLLDYLRRG